MNFFSVLVIVPLFFGVGVSLAGDDSLKSVEAVGMHVTKRMRRREESFGAQTSVELLVRQPGKHIVGLDSIKVTSFTDDKKTDLLKNTDIGKFAGLVPAEREFRLTLGSADLPARGAVKLHVQGTIAIKAGKDETTIEEKNIKLKNAERTKFGPFELSCPEQNDFPDQPPQTFIAICYTDNIIKSIEFLDKRGKTIPVLAEYPSYGYGSGKDIASREISFTRQFSLRGKVEEVTVRVTYFGKSEIVTVPFNLEFGLGL